MNKQIEEISCKRCVHYEVCRFVNALAVANVVNAENCRMFKDTKGYRKASDVAREIFEEVDKLIYRLLNDVHYIAGDLVWDINELKKKYESEGEDDERQHSQESDL
jgi:hypothetical protein